ncbi:MAG: BON domain-containing protein [Humidesulfovibrio sp.]|uniref:BON domain-containing protein n=1 Tax=Humidesulfovibrio sp. TaxID=2910988 RepID=UPI0027EA2875|nr:BON domain-containing protein [Humidesulfovibrio sp.]MDQ7834641.1 BON domain-containing protein [Humidesulfovibrio sp.]
MRKLCLTALLCLLALCTSGCAALPLLAVGDVLSVAEAGKTGFDMAAGINSRQSLSQDTSDDAQAEARLRARLHSLGGMLAQATPHVTQGRAYIVGTYANPRELERARNATRNVKGVRELTLCLFPAGSGRHYVTDGELRDNILRMSGIRTRDVRVQVVEGNAVLLGRVRTNAERQRLNDSAHDSGASSVRNYVQLLASN